MKRKTIFIIIQGRQQARNILRTDVFKVLRSQPDLRIVVFVPAIKVDEYKKEFSTEVGSAVIFEGVVLPSLTSFFDKVFYRLAILYANTAPARFVRKQWLLWEKKQRFRYFFSISLLSIIGSSNITRNSIRFFDYHLVIDNRLTHFFNTYNPDLVFATNILSELDSAFLRQAKKKNVPTVGIVNSWDNISSTKHPFRLLPDTLIVHNKIIKQEALQYLGMKEKNIFVSGMPHFDHYVTSKRVGREAFCKKFGIDPDKKILLFASIAGINNTEWQVLSMLDRAITQKQLPDDIVVLVRHHPAMNLIHGDVSYSDNIVFDDSKTVFKKHNEIYSEILKEDMGHLADSLYHANLLVTTRSTTSIDASAFDTPIIDLGFDGWEKKPYHQSVAMLYDPSYTHYQPIIKSGGVRRAHSFEELVSFINRYFKDPSLDREGRKRIVREQCYTLDGKSGERIGLFVLSLF